MSGLRERRHAETKQAISAAAFALFDEVGFTATTMELIAERAGVSRSTAYRRFASKEDIVLEVPHQWLAAWDRAIEDLEPGASLADAMAAGCYAVAANIDNSAELVLAAYRALSESPALQSSGAATAEWVKRMAFLVADREPELEDDDVMTIAGAYMGAIDAMMFGWSTNGGTTRVSEATGNLLTRLAPILP